MRRRSTRTSVRPRRSPSTRTSPLDGCSYIAAILSSVVFPEPFGAEHDPPLTRQHLPRQRRQDRAVVANEADVDEPQDHGLLQFGRRCPAWRCDDIATQSKRCRSGPSTHWYPRTRDASDSGNCVGGVLFRAAVVDHGRTRRRSRRPRRRRKRSPTPASAPTPRPTPISHRNHGSTSWTCSRSNCSPRSPRWRAM